MSEIQWEDELHAIIPNQLPARLMRHLMFCKGGLAEAGSIYYGAGDTETVEYQTANGTVTYEIPKVNVLNGPESNGTYQLICKKTDNGVELSWQPVEDVEDY